MSLLTRRASVGGDYSGSGPFRPDDIANLAVWLDADSIIGLSDGDPVATWTDESGNGNDASQGTVSKQPTYKTGILNSLPVVRFDGGDGLSVADDASYKTARITMFVVAVANTTLDSIAGYPHAATHTSPFWRWSIFRANSNDVDTRWNGNLSRTAITWTSHQLFELIDAALLVNGSAVHAGTAADLTYPNAVGLRIGQNASGAEGLSGDIAELLIYSRSLTTAERESVRGYFADKYAITMA